MCITFQNGKRKTQNFAAAIKETLVAFQLFYIKEAKENPSLKRNGAEVTYSYILISPLVYNDICD
jgi:uncharacterized protein Veg